MPEPTTAVLAAGGAGDGRCSIAGRFVEARVGLLTDGSTTSYCPVQALSLTGAEVKLFGSAEVGARIALRLGEESPFAGWVAWIRDGVAGLKFAAAIDCATLLRAQRVLPPTSDCLSPRSGLAPRIFLRSVGRTHAAVLRDISVMGAKVQTLRPISPEPSIVLILLGLPPILAFVRWSDHLDLGLEFDRPLPIQLIAARLGGRVNVSG